MLIVHGKDDPIVPASQSENLHAKLLQEGADSTLYIVEGAGHGDGAYWTTMQARERVLSFFDRVFLMDGRRGAPGTRL